MSFTANQTPEQFRVSIGMQCPECFGARISTKTVSRADPRFVGWQCEECGCNWSPVRAPSKPKAA